jgi:hypothetical protein
LRFGGIVIIFAPLNYQTHGSNGNNKEEGKESTEVCATSSNVEKQQLQTSIEKYRR